MRVAKTNFLAGVAVGVALAVVPPLAAVAFFADLANPALATTPATPIVLAPQSVNRAGKSDRLHVPQNATRTPALKSPSIPEGCDPAFSPLSKGAGSIFTGRCLA
jgi:hypothetical protein